MVEQMNNNNNNNNNINNGFIKHFRQVAPYLNKNK